MKWVFEVTREYLIWRDDTHTLLNEIHQSLLPWYSEYDQCTFYPLYERMAGNRWNEFYTKEAKKRWLVARSYFKLEELHNRFDLFGDKPEMIIDIWCAPGSRLQYCSQYMIENSVDGTILWFDLKKTTLQLPHTHTYEQDIREFEKVDAIIAEHSDCKKFDMIISDMAPDTIGMADIDALRSVWLIEKTLWIYDKYLVEWWKFAIKVFMWPGFDELLRELKGIYGAWNVVTYKPKSCRKKSKETYIVKNK